MGIRDAELCKATRASQWECYAPGARSGHGTEGRESTVF